MTPVRWSVQASEDLQAIHDYIARDSAHYAIRTVERILEAVDQLQDFPEVGHVVPEFRRNDIREIIVRPYRIVYELESDSVGLITIVHGAQRLRDSPDSV